MEQQGRRGPPEPMEQLGPPEQQGRRAQREQRGPKDQSEQQVRKVRLGPQEPLDQRAPLAPPGRKVPLGRPELRARLGQPGQRGPSALRRITRLRRPMRRARLSFAQPPVRRTGRAISPWKMETRDLIPQQTQQRGRWLRRPGQPELRDQRVRPGRKVPRERPVLRVPPGLLVRREQLARPEFRARPGRKEPREPPALRVPPGLLARRERPARLELRARQGRQDRRVKARTSSWPTWC